MDNEVLQKVLVGTTLLRWSGRLTNAMVVSDMSLSTSCDEDLFIPSLLVANSLANSCARPDSSLPAPCTMTSKF
eukprot:scaffold51457_cov33-Tisochrysis_lutea.AAC.3